VAIESSDDLVASFHGQQRLRMIKVTNVNMAIQFNALWYMNGIPGIAPTPTPGLPGEVLTKGTPGAPPFDNPTGGAFTYLYRADAGSGGGHLMLYDRLWHNSGLSATSLTAQTVNSVALNRPDNRGDQAELWLDAYTSIGAHTTPPTVSYTDQDGNAGATATIPQTMVTAIGMPTQWETIPFNLAAGDSGIRSIQSYTNTATMTSGTFGLVIRRLVFDMLSGAQVGTYYNGFQLGMPRIHDDACLELIASPMTNAVWPVSVGLVLVQG
jgi:hypothetical protein